MKNILIAVLLFMGISANAQIKSAELVASGLTCSMCSKSIYKALEKVASIKSIDANVERSSFSIRFKDGATVSLDEVKGAVEKAGFSVASMIVTASFHGEEVQNDAHVSIGGNTYHFLNVPKKKLSGDVAIKVVDKDFIPAKDRRKFAKYTTMKCFETGTRAECCPRTSSSNRVYHVTI